MSGGAYVLHSHSRGVDRGFSLLPPLFSFFTPLFSLFLPLVSFLPPLLFSFLPATFSFLPPPLSFLPSILSFLPPPLSFLSPPSPSTLSAPYIWLRDCSQKKQFLLGRFAQTGFFFTGTINPGRFAQMVKMWNKKFLIENFKLQ